MPDKPTVLVLDDYEGGLAGSPHLAGLADEIDLVARSEPIDADRLERELDGVTVVIAIRERTRFTAETLARMRGVELLLQTGGHAYHVDVPAATKNGVLVALGRGSKAPAPVVAELVIGLVLAWYRRLVPATQSVRAGGWSGGLGRLLGGRTLGVLGLGRHGTQVAGLARAMGLHVLCWSPTLTPERAAAAQVEAVGFDELLVRSDIVSVHLRLAPETIGLLGARELALMGPDALLVNTSRGPIVDEPALVEALRDGTIEGAALDVFDQEPLPPAHPFRTLDNVLATPHLGYRVDAAFDDFAQTSAAQLRSYLARDLDPGLVLNPEVRRDHRGRWGGLRTER